MKKDRVELGDKVVLTRNISSCLNEFHKGDIVTVVGISGYRGYTYRASDGTEINEAGFDCKLHQKGDTSTFKVTSDGFSSTVEYNQDYQESIETDVQLSNEDMIKSNLRTLSEMFSLKTKHQIEEALNYIESLEKEIATLKK